MCPPLPVFQKLVSAVVAVSQVTMTMPPAAYHCEPSTTARFDFSQSSPTLILLVLVHLLCMSLQMLGTTNMKFGAVLPVRSLTRPVQAVVSAKGTTRLH